MCEYFSFCTDGKGVVFYFEPKDIKKIRKEGNKKHYEFNSHASICSFYNIKEDKTNKYEYNPFFREFKVDQLNNTDDSERAKDWVTKFFGSMNREKLLKFSKNYFYQVDYKALEKDLGDIPTKNDVIKLMKDIEKIDFFKPQKEPNKFNLQLKIDSILKAFKLDVKAELQINSLDTNEAWASARDSARDSAWASAWASARDSARNSARNSAWDSARDSAWNSARNSAWNSARDSAWNSARNSAWASEFEVVKDLMESKGYKKNPFKELIGLCKLGLYPIGILKDGKFHVYYAPLKEDKK